MYKLYRKLKLILDILLKRPRFTSWKLHKQPDLYCVQYHHPRLNLRVRGYGTTKDEAYIECCRTRNKLLRIYLRKGVLN